MRAFRWGFLVLAGALSSALSVGCGAEPRDASQESAAAITAKQGTASLPEGATRLRVVSANLTSGNLQSYDPGNGLRILQALAPDVVLLQEFNFGDNSEAALQGFVDNLGTGYTYGREPNGQIPNGVISRYPILSSGFWPDPRAHGTRNFFWARIDVPGPKDLWAVSLHLLTSNSSNRQAQAAAIVASIRTQIPEGDYMVLGGDLNTKSRGEGCLSTFRTFFRTTGPYPVDPAGNENTNRNREDPYDWVMADMDLDPLEIPLEVGGRTFDHGVVFDTRRFSPPVAPALTSDSSSTNMQHMAVARDFALPPETAVTPPAPPQPQE